MHLILQREKRSTICHDPWVLPEQHLICLFWRQCHLRMYFYYHDFFFIFITIWIFRVRIMLLFLNSRISTCICIFRGSIVFRCIITFLAFFSIFISTWIFRVRIMILFFKSCIPISTCMFRARIGSYTLKVRISAWIFRIMTGCNFTILTIFALQLEGSELEPALVNLELGLFSDAFFSSGIVLIIESLELEHFRLS